MSTAFIHRFSGRMKRIDWIDNLVRRNPLHYRRMERIFNWIEHAELADRKRWVKIRLALICAKASGTPYGRRSGGDANIDSWPLLEKEQVRANPNDFMKSFPFLASPANTSGTTGVPLKLFRSPSSVVVEQLVIDKLVDLAGFSLRNAKIAALKGDNIKCPSDMRPPFWKYTLGGNKLLLSSNHLNKETIDYYHEEIHQYSPDCLFGYPTSIESLCGNLRLIGKLLNVPLVVTSSEVLHDHVREQVEDALNCRVFEYYGQSERVAFAVSMNPNEFFFWPSYAHVELLYNSSDRESDFYEIIGTTLWNTTMPLIRYRTGDLIQVPKGTGAEELEEIRYGVKPFVRLVGRSEDWYLDSPEGTRLMAIPQIPRDVNNIVRMQIIQEKLDEVRFLVIPTENFSEQDEAHLLKNAYAKIPQSMKIRIERVNLLEKTKRGKIPFVIRRWEGEHELYNIKKLYNDDQIV